MGPVLSAVAEYLIGCVPVARLAASLARGKSWEPLAVRLAVVVLPGHPPDIVEALVGVAVGVAVYGGALSAMRVREVAEIVRRLRSRRAG